MIIHVSCRIWNTMIAIHAEPKNGYQKVWRSLLMRRSKSRRFQVVNGDGALSSLWTLKHQWSGNVGPTLQVPSRAARHDHNQSIRCEEDIDRRLFTTTTTIETAKIIACFRKPCVSNRTTYGESKPRENASGLRIWSLCLLVVMTEKCSGLFERFVIFPTVNRALAGPLKDFPTLYYDGASARGKF